MNDSGRTKTAPRRSALGQLIVARLREFYRRPEAIFWVYGFPLLMVVALGTAFRNKPVQKFTIDVEEGPGAASIAAMLKSEGKPADKPHLEVTINNEATCRLRLRTGKTDLVVVPEGTDHDHAVVARSPDRATAAGSNQLRCKYLYDNARPESVLARQETDDTLERALGRPDKLSAQDVQMSEPGSRYIDFLVPGLLGMNILGGGLWGVGFVIVDMRIRKLLKRFIATPMRKSHFLLGIMLSRQLFMLSEMVLLVLFAYFVFNVVISGSLWAIAFLLVLGAFTFAGIGLLVASRAQTLETVSGLMNLVMLPMWVFSGIFFSSERFPAFLQPVIKIIPLTPLIDALRAVMLEGATLASQWTRILILAIWTVGTFFLALKWFRWQ
jgi:ABC-type multidrug transport system permease subunit